MISKFLQILGLQHRIFFSITRTILVTKYHFLLNSQMNFKSLFISDFSCWILQLQWVPETRPKNLWSSWKNYVKMVLDFVFCFSLDYHGIYGGNQSKFILFTPTGNYFQVQNRYWLYFIHGTFSVFCSHYSTAWPTLHEKVSLFKDFFCLIRFWIVYLIIKKIFT